MRRMPAKIYRIKLSIEERNHLESIRDKGSHKAIKFRRAVVLLLADEGEFGSAIKDADIAQSTGLHPNSIERIRKRCCEVGPIGALDAKPRETPPREIKITGEVEAHITQIACSEAPEGAARWTFKLIAERLVEIEVIDSISPSSVGLVLKKVNLNHGNKKDGVFLQNKTRAL